MEQSEFGLDFSNFLQQPFVKELKGSKRILIAGCGGGYDFFSGLPIYFSLVKSGAICFLSNQSFTNPSKIPEKYKYTDVCYKVTADATREATGWTIVEEDYWPELRVSMWFKNNKNQDVPVYMIMPSGVIPIQSTYQKIVNDNKIDTIILVDGGTDSIMFGNEQGLGTPTEDMASIASVHQVKVDKKFLFNIGFGVDSFHGVNHYLYLENVAKLSKEGAFLGSFSLIHTTEEAQMFEEIYRNSNPENSIVCSSILSAVKGEFGNHHHSFTSSRTRGSKLFISALMSMYFAFKLENVAKNVLYLPELYSTKTQDDVHEAIHNYCEEKGFFTKGRYTGPRKVGNIPY